MKNSTPKSIFQTALEKEIPPAGIGLWHAVKERLVARKSPLFQQGEKMNRKPVFRRAIPIVLALTVAFTTLFATPQGRAWAQGLLKYFARSQNEVITVSTAPINWVDTTVTATPQSTSTALPGNAATSSTVDCGRPPLLTCTTEQVRAKVKFTVKELNHIPDGLYFNGASDSADMITILYDSPDHSGALALLEQSWPNKSQQNAWPIGPSAAVETVQVGAVTGEYVQGSYVQHNGVGDAVWDPNLDTQRLHWVENGVFFQMEGSITKVDKATFIELAANLTTDPVSATSPAMPTPISESNLAPSRSDYFPLTIAEAAQQAGFPVKRVDKLPDYLLWLGAKYDAANGVVIIEYTDATSLQLGAMNGLTLSQQVAPNPDDCHLCGILTGDFGLVNSEQKKDPFHLIVPPTANLETVQIGNQTGLYVEGHWFGNGDWTSDDVKTLRWLKDGVAFELVEIGTGLQKADIIAIAKSLK
jgi:hypothetical protein